MKYLILALLLFLFSPITNATVQIDELLQLDGARFEIEELPLRTHPDYEKISKNIGEASDEACSASWRGYRGYWKIRVNKLWLMYINVSPCSDKPKIIYPVKIFTNTIDLTFADQSLITILADWYTGTITFRISEYTDLKIKTKGKESGYEHEAVVYQIEKGKVVSRSIKKIKTKYRQDIF